MNYTPYYGVCALLWLVAWAIGLWYFQSRRKRGPLIRRLSWKQRICLVAAVIAVPVVYVGSYPLYRRLVTAFPDQQRWLGAMEDLYVPVQFVTNPSPSYEPILYPLTVLVVVLIPFVIDRVLIFARVRRPHVIGALLVAALAIACFVFMLGPI